MDEPGNGKWFLVDLREARKPILFAARAFQPETVVALRCVQGRWKRLNTESVGKEETYRRSSSLRF